MRSVDAEFAEWVHAKQHGLLRAAYLACRDERRAEDAVLQALVRLALRWNTVRHEDRDTFVQDLVQRRVHRRAIPPMGSALAHAGSEPPLADLAREVRTVDLVEAAWRGAEAHRRMVRRRTVGAVAAAALALGAGWAGLGSAGAPDADPPPTSEPPVTLRIPTLPDTTALAPVRQSQPPWIDPRGWRRHPNGARSIRMPEPEQVRSLPQFDDPLAELYTRGTTDLTVTPETAPFNPPRAVYLEADPSGGMLFRPMVLAGRDVLRVNLVWLKAVDPRLYSLYETTFGCLSPDGRSLVFAQQGGVVTIDLVDRAVRSTPVPDPDLYSAGWAVDEPGVVIARSPGRQWRIEPLTRAVTTATAAENDSRYEIRAVGQGGALVLDRFEAGTVAHLDRGAGLGTPIGRAISGRGRVAVAVRGMPGLGGGADWSLLVLDTRRLDNAGRPDRRVLGLPHGLGGQPVGWDRSGRYLLFDAGIGGGSYVLAWDLETGGLHQVVRNADPERTLPVALGYGFVRD